VVNLPVLKYHTSSRFGFIGLGDHKFRLSPPGLALHGTCACWSKPIRAK